MERTSPLLIVAEAAPGERALAPARDATVAAEQIMRRHARSFSLAARLLPAAQRQPTTILYAFYRMLDDLVDEPPAGWSAARIAAELDAWEAWLRGGLPPSG